VVPAQKILFPDRNNDPNLVVLRVRVRDARYWKGAGNFIERAFVFSRAVLDEFPSNLVSKVS
jgi:hypothetical protein